MLGVFEMSSEMFDLFEQGFSCLFDFLPVKMYGECFAFCHRITKQKMQGRIKSDSRGPRALDVQRGSCGRIRGIFVSSFSLDLI